VKNLSVSNAKTLSHDDSNSHSLSSDGHELRGDAWGHGPLPPSGSATAYVVVVVVARCVQMQPLQQQSIVYGRVLGATSTALEIARLYSL